jgi:hypothetical protein
VFCVSGSGIYNTVALATVKLSESKVLSVQDIPIIDSPAQATATHAVVDFKGVHDLTTTLFAATCALNPDSLALCSCKLKYPNTMFLN